MILRWLICFSLAVAWAPAASVKGSIAITNGKGRESHSTDLSGTVVWLQPELGSVMPVRHSSEKVTIVQKNKMFLPHVLAIPVGTSVDFPNFDPIFHNAFSNYNGQMFDVGLYPPGSSRSVAFRREGVVRVFCNIHSSMSAVIVVLRSPYYAVSKADGSFEIPDVPEGSYRMHFYYERATDETLAARSRALEVESADQSVGVVTISESGYLPMPHMNKYGKPYGSSNETLTYPGAR